ncbi:hypothetical protein Tco_1357007 [Tanacetum coccineum]
MFGVQRMISSKEDKHYKEGIFLDFCKGMKIMQSFSPITDYTEIINRIEKQLIRSQQGWADNVARAIIPSTKSLITKEEGRTTKETAKRKGGEDREVAYIEEAEFMIVTTAGYVSTAGEVQRKYSKSLLLLVVKLLLLVLVTTARRVSAVRV